MSVSDPIADMFTCIRNANMKYFESVDVLSSNMKESILAILYKEGFIRNYKKIDSGSKPLIRVYLKYGDNKEKVINGIKRVSTPGLRVYKRINEIKRVRSGLGVAIVSTSKGVFSDKEARENKIGGEIIGYIW